MNVIDAVNPAQVVVVVAAVCPANANIYYIGMISKVFLRQLKFGNDKDVWLMRVFFLNYHQKLYDEISESFIG